MSQYAGKERRKPNLESRARERTVDSAEAGFARRMFAQAGELKLWLTQTRRTLG